MTEEVLSYFERCLLNELNRIASALEELRDAIPTVEVQEKIAEHLEYLPSIAADMTSIDKTLGWIDR